MASASLCSHCKTERRNLAQPCPTNAFDSQRANPRDQYQTGEPSEFEPRVKTSRLVAKLQRASAGPDHHATYRAVRPQDIHPLAVQVAFSAACWASKQRSS